MSSLLTLESVSCAYGQHAVVADVSLSLAEGEILALLGPSGCGKTTLLRAIAGFNPLAGGRMKLRGNQISAMDDLLPPEKRRMGMVFQDYALFPHLTVAENISFGLQALSRVQKQARAEEMLRLVRLPNLSKRYPHELSGGQQQRVALARALAPKPQLLLMDEPFSNLDTELRKKLSLEVRDILKEQGIAAIMVTHDQEEAFAIADRVGILANGRLQQLAAPFEIYHEPVNPLVADFVGKGELFAGTCLGEGVVETPQLGTLEFAEPLGVIAGQKVQLFIRPGDIHPAFEGGVKAQISGVEFLGGLTRYRLTLECGREISSEVRHAQPHRVGEEVSVEVAAHKPVVFTDIALPIA